MRYHIRRPISVSNAHHGANVESSVKSVGIAGTDDGSVGWGLRRTTTGGEEIISSTSLGDGGLLSHFNFTFVGVGCSYFLEG